MKELFSSHARTQWFALLVGKRRSILRALRVPGPLDTGALHALLDPDPGATPTGLHDHRDDRRVRMRKQVDPHEPAVKPFR